MLFRKKYERALALMKEKNREYLDSMGSGDEQADPDSVSGTRDTAADTAEEKARGFHKGEKLDLEKGDLTAMILSAFLVFGPIFLLLVGILAAAWILLH